MIKERLLSFAKARTMSFTNDCMLQSRAPRLQTFRNRYEHPIGQNFRKNQWSLPNVGPSIQNSVRIVVQGTNSPTFRRVRNSRFANIMFCLLRTWTWGWFSNWCFLIGLHLIPALIGQSFKPMNINLKTHISITNNGKSMIINQLLSLLSSVRKISISPTQKLKKTLHLLVHLPSKTDFKTKYPRSVFSDS